MADSVSIEGENERYAATLVFVHGLWVGPEIWRPAAIGFAHRGWRCVLLDSRASELSGSGFAAWCAAVAEQAPKHEHPPIVIGHDAGGLVALSLAERGLCLGAIAVAPLLDGPGGILEAPSRIQAWLGLGSVAPPGPSHGWRQVGAQDGEARLASSLVAEPAARLRSVARDGTTPGSPRSPCLLVAQAEDRVVPTSLVETTANGIEADYRQLPGGHWPMLERGLDGWMSQLHRWMIQRWPGLVMLKGDEDLRDE